MALETGNFINDLNQTYPTATDTISEGDGHLQLIKKVLKQSFAGVDRASEYIYVHTSAPTVDVGKGRLWLDTSTTPNLLKICDAVGPPATFIKLPISATVSYKLMGNDTVGWVLPTADGTANYPLTTTGSNVLAFAQLASAGIADDAVTTDKIINNAVDGTKIAMGSDAAGDVLYHNGTDYVRLAKPATPKGEILSFNTSAVAPSWVLGSGFYASASSGTSIPSGSETRIDFATEAYDINGDYANPTWTPAKGHYLIHAMVSLQTPAGLSSYSKSLIVTIYKDGSKEYEGDQTMMRYSSTNTVSSSITAAVYSDGTDAWDIRVYQNSGSTISNDAGNTDRFLGAALPIGDST
jgi:hypothetical protein